MAFENEANRQLQFSLLSSKLVVRDELVQECFYMCNRLREARKNIIALVDHILQHDLVQESPIAAEFVSTMEKEMQNIKNVSTPK